MSNKLRSLDLMKYLQSFTQGGVIKATEARIIVDSYSKGDTRPLTDLIKSPAVPMGYSTLINKLAEFI